MKRLIKLMFGTAVSMLVLGSIVAYASFPMTISNDNFDSYFDNDDYIIVNSWGWTSWSTHPTPVVKATNYVSAPNSLTRPFTDDKFYAMQKTLSSEDVLNVDNPGDLTFSVWVRCRNAFWSPLVIQIGENGGQDRVYFSTGGNSSWTYKYRGNGDVWHDILDLGGQPLEVSHGDSETETFNRVELKMTWNALDVSYGSTYTVQIFDQSNNPLSPLTTCEIVDEDARDNGTVDVVDWFGLTAGAGQHEVWLDNLVITAEAAVVDYTPQNPLAKKSVTIGYDGAEGYLYKTMVGDTPPGDTEADVVVAGENDGEWTDSGDDSRSSPGDVDKRFYRTTEADVQ
jgi:hypothetical protein